MIQDRCVQRRRLVPLPARPRPRLPRRHDPRQRRGRAADEGRAAALPAALPQRLQRARLHARARQRARDDPDRLRRRPAAGSRSTRTSIPLEPAERVDVLVDFRQFGVGSKVILHNTIGEPSTSAVMRFDVVKGGAEEARIPKRAGRGRGAARGQRGALVAADLPGPGRRRVDVADRRRRLLARTRIDCRPRQGSTELWTWRQPVPAHAPDAPARLPLPRGQRRRRSRRTRGDRGLEGHGARSTRTRPSSCGRTSTTSPGVYVFHCHAAEHGDMSMMGQMEVVA